MAHIKPSGRLPPQMDMAAHSTHHAQKDAKVDPTPANDRKLAAMKMIVSKPGASGPDQVGGLNTNGTTAAYYKAGLPSIASRENAP